MRYEEKDLVRIAKRENNNKRSYLVVDRCRENMFRYRLSKHSHCFLLWQTR